MSSIIEKPRFSCALAAQQTVLAIPGAAPIIHAGPGCASKASGFAGVQAGQQGEGTPEEPMYPVPMQGRRKLYLVEKRTLKNWYQVPFRLLRQISL